MLKVLKGKEKQPFWGPLKKTLPKAGKSKAGGKARVLKQADHVFDGFSRGGGTRKQASLGVRYFENGFQEFSRGSQPITHQNTVVLAELPVAFPAAGLIEYVANPRGFPKNSFIIEVVHKAPSYPLALPK